jgi:2-polyprenyl-3-methyl-5-hydroxy-6-metoxy-1,4-benzoquinol methylase
MSSIYDLWTNRHGPPDPAAERMLHPIPDAPVVDREAFILERCAGRRVLHVGSNGTDGKGAFHEAIKGVAEAVYGLDRGGADINVDLDRMSNMQDAELAHLCDDVLDLGVDLVVCGEVLEHLANPGYFLEWIRPLGATVILTVPNAFSRAAAISNAQGRECVNVDHVCWYSWRTLKTLVERYGYTVAEWYWYNGEPLVAEGLVFVVRPE